MKLYTIGIDGATYRIIRPLVEAGKLPNIGKILHEGCSGRLASTVPPLSPVAWTTITTGATPAVHGIIDFLGYNKTTGQNYLFDSTHRQVDPVWTLAGKVGKRSCVVNVPLTYPVDELNGFMISGLGTPPTNEGLAYPLEEFKKMKHSIGGYHIDIDIQENQKYEKVAGLFQKVMEKRQKCFDFLLAREAWDLFFFVFTNTDRAQHVYWREHDAENSPFTDVIAECYQEADRAVGKAMAKAEAEGGVVMIVSDHGFGPLKNRFSLSSWLHSKGMLTPNRTMEKENPLKGAIKKHVPTQLKKFLIRTVFKSRQKFSGSSAELSKWLDWEKTKIYSHKKVDTVYLFVNDAAFADSAQRSTFIEEFQKELLAVKDPKTGENIVLDVFDGQQIFGTDNPSTPDLMFIPADGYNFSFDSRDIERDDPFVGIPQLWSGTHESEGVFMAWGEHINAGRDCGDLSIMDALPTMCYIMDLPIPWWAEGKVVHQAFTEDFLHAHKERREKKPSGIDGSSNTPVGAMNEAESEEVVKRLKALGYL
ncbi:MAG: alkaline phosphatase family protein [Candidatus Electrothrix communis]|nr:alkaline phosphatase family protein [Desulfobulbus sp. US4]WLE98562.1 MAG: alkaline phosphatase family protein [Candidatus Electrothrix communis]